MADTDVDRVYIAAEGPDDEAVAVGIRWLTEFATGRGDARAALFVYGLRNVKSLGRALGAQMAQALEKDRQVRIAGITVDLVTEKTLRSYQDGPLLAVWVDDKELDSIDALGAPGICAIPWTRTGIDGWKTNWNPTDLRTGEAGGSEEPVSNVVIAAAMDSLTNRVNLSTGIIHPSDKAAAYEMFTRLKGAGEPFVPSEVRAYAVRAGWRPDYAREPSELARKVIDGRLVKVEKGRTWREDIVEQWREAARDPGGDADEETGDA